MNTSLQKMVLIKKQDELNDLSNEQNPTQEITDRIEELKKEIKRIKSTIARYEIAKLLGLENDSKYKSIGYIGIEEEDTSKLSADELNTFNTLLQDVDLNETLVYSNRIKMARILGVENKEELKHNNYSGIEKENASSSIYGLSQDQIDEFNRLKQEVESLISSMSDIKVDEQKAANDEMLRLFDELNVRTIAEYENKKNQLFDELCMYIESTRRQEEGQNAYGVKFGAINNYSFAMDLKKKYPELDIEMNITSLTELFNKVRTDNSMDKEKYEDYLTFLSENIKKLYQDDNNKAAIVALINSIGSNEYKFRIDLHSKLGNLEGIDLSLKDSEIEPLFKMLDQNYDSLDEELRNKYFNFISGKLSEKLKDPYKADEVNKLLVSVKNQNFNKKLQETYRGEKFAKFSNIHISASKDLINDEIKKLEAKKAQLLKKDYRLDMLDARRDVKVAKIEKEIEKLKSMELSYDSNPILNSMDSRYNAKTDKIIKIEKEIADLKKLKGEVKSKFAQKIIDKKIKKKTEKVKLLSQAKTKIIGNQKTMMLPKAFVNRKKGFFGRGVEAKAETYDVRSNDYKLLAEEERKRNGLFSGIKAAFYDFRAGKYETKAKLNQALLDKLNNGQVKVDGNNSKLMPKKAVDALRRNNQQDIVQVM